MINYAHFQFYWACYGLVWDNFVHFRQGSFTSTGQLYNCLSASEVTLKNMGIYIYIYNIDTVWTTIKTTASMNHNKTKGNKTISHSLKINMLSYKHRHSNYNERTVSWLFYHYDEIRYTWKDTPAYCMVSQKLSVPNCVTVLDSSHNEWGDGGIKSDLVERRIPENYYCALSSCHS